MSDDPSAMDKQSSLFATAEESVTYEQPLNERIRALLRLEYLFDGVEHRINGADEWDSRTALTGLIEVTDLLSRFDLKAELNKELERHAGILQGLQQNPGVDPARLQDTQEQINELLVTMRSNSCQPAQILRKDELIYAIKQRLPIPGGTCNFDLPAYHHWLTRPVAARVEQLHYWFNDLRIIKDAVELVLRLIRDSARPQTVIAVAGFYQQPVDSNTVCQLVRVMVRGSLQAFPEISGGRHRFTIRFLEQPSSANRPAQTDMDVQFELQCCNL
jgi:cell division protein ZapD